MPTKRGPPSIARAKVERVRTAKSRSASSTRWLERQLNDPYVAEAKRVGYRSRAAFKLTELDDRFHVLKPGQRVLDLGAAPGGWSQVASVRVKSREGRGKVVATDLLPVDPVPGVIFLERNFLAVGVEAELLTALGGPPDIILSDMAAPTTGHNATDHLRIVALVEAAYDFAVRCLAPGGAFIAKVFHGGAEGELLKRMKQNFASVKHAKPPASRAESAEVYVVAQGFRGGK